MVIQQPNQYTFDTKAIFPNECVPNYKSLGNVCLYTYPKVVL